MYTIKPETIKALALDLDGTTLRPDNTLSARTIRALKICIDRGIRVIICTGRSIGAAEPYRLALGAVGPMVYFNGAEVVDMPGGKLLNTAFLDREVLDFCVDLSRNQGIYFQVYFPVPSGESGAPTAAGELLMAERQSEETEMYRKHTGIQAVIGDLKAAIPGQQGCIKSMFITDPATQDLIRPKLIEQFGSRVYVTRTHPAFLEILHPRASKGLGLQHAMSYLNLAPAELIAFGDEENDLPLFTTAGFSAAPANAKESVRKAANMVIGSNGEDGVAAFLEEVLIHFKGH
ncbi:MAG: Cof-type HAD-IIB family hydrolase [Treponema sp.]|jgi:Cof subfamily protein (haloacid dehalogenase superfamily)|nr:Cof-type HAD-IIB family hydrolase [Treponema sp.]